VYPILAYGIYKVTSNVTDKYFYLDYRDCRIGYYNYYPPEPNGHWIDLWIKYNYSEDSFSYSSSSFITDFHNISNGQLLNFWDIKEKAPQLTSLFPNYWQNCLAVINGGNGNPRLVWGPNPDFENILGYKIYRAVHWVPNPNPIVYYLIATVDDETFDYKDIQLSLSQSGDYVWYYVKAYNSQTQSSPSNVVTTRAGFYKTNNFDKVNSTGYGISQNFPNPFNPSTNISYSIAEKGSVKLAVYNMLGEEVASLVDESKEAGNYSVVFNAGLLPSGIYFYKLQVENFVATKKLILLK
jgi:hypothetical protein